MRVLMPGIVLAIAAAICTPTSADDQQIAEFIKAKLLEEKQRGNLFGFNVDMRVDRGTVWFKGFVSNRSQELMILRTAQLAGHLGVVQVVDDIDVNGQSAENVTQPVLRREVQQQRPAMTSIPGPAQQQLQAQQPPQQYAPPQPMAQQSMERAPQLQQMYPQQMYPQQMYPPQMYPQQMQQGYPGQMQQQQMPMQQQQQQQMVPGPMQQPMPMPQTMPYPPQPSQAPMPMPMPRQTQADFDTDAQSVGYQEPMFAPEMDRTSGPYQQPYSNMPEQGSHQRYPADASYGQPVPAPAFQQSLSRPMQSGSDAMAPPMPSETRISPPVKLVSSTSQPLPFARATAAAQGCDSGACGGPMMADGGYGGYGGDGGGTGITSDSANLPGYAWPAYASHPNYGAVSYPKQYSPSAWPYIGPFYPYPQVPLGWRKVALEWDDGWWYLDFDDKN